MSKTYYSDFFPVVGNKGVKGTTIPVATTQDIVDINDNINHVNDKADQIREDLENFQPMDVIAPEGIQGLTLTTEIVLDTDGKQIVSVKATWIASSAPDLNHYDIDIREEVGGNFVSFYVGGDKTYHQWSVRANRNFYVRIRGIDHAGNAGPWSNIVTILSARDNIPPAPPTGLVVETAFETAFLSWTNALDEDLELVEIWENLSNSTSGGTKIGVVSAQRNSKGSYTRSGLGRGVTRYYYLRSVDTSGNASVFSTVITATTVKINIADFNQGLAPIPEVNGLPDPTGYEGPKVVFNTADGKLYRYHAGAWTSSIPGADVTGAVGTTEIPDGGIGLSKFASGVAPVERHVTLPTSGNFYGRVVMLTTNGKIYRWNSTESTGNFWTASVDGADITASSITGGKIQAGTIQTNHLAAESITASKLLVSGGKMLNTDPFMSDINAWDAPGITFVTDPTSITGGVVARGFAVANTPGNYVFAKTKIPVDINATYRVYGSFRRSSEANGKIYLVVQLLDQNNVNIEGDGTYWYYPVASYDPPDDDWHSFTVKFGAKGSRQFPANARYMRVGYLINYFPTTSTGFTDAQNIFIEEAISGELVVDGSIKAEHITAGAVIAGKLGADAVEANNIKAGAVTVSKLAAQTITAEKLAIGVMGSNLLINGSAESQTTPGQPDGWIKSPAYGGTISTSTLQAKSGNNSFRLSKPAGGTVGLLSRKIPVTGGISYVLRAWGIGSAPTSSGIYFRVWSRTTNPSGDYVTNDGTPVYEDLPANVGIGTTWQQYQGNYTAPANAKWVSIEIINFTPGPTETYFDDIEFFQQTTSAVIQDGAITTEKMVVNSILGDRIKTDTLDAAKIKADTVLAGSITVGGNRLDTAHTSATWSGVSGKPPNLFKNLIDTSFYRIGQATNTTLNLGTQLVSWNQTAVGENSFIMAEGPSGMSEPVLQGESLDTVGNAGEGSGGHDIIFSNGYDPTKTYLYTAWVSRKVFGGSVYLGCHGAGHTLRLDGTVDSNPYFWAGTVPAINQWYLMVGVLHGSGYTGPDSGISGLYDPQTGRRLAAGGDYKSAPGATNQQLRMYQYYTGLGSISYFSAPTVEMVDGNINILNKFAKFNASAAINAGTTQIDPGKILISGSTTLANWRRGGDDTRIDGGAVSANTITANKLSIGNRGISTIGIDFTWNRALNRIEWSEGLIYFNDDNGTPNAQYISPGFTTGPPHQFIWWAKGSGTLSSAQQSYFPTSDTTVPMASWWGGGRLNVNFGGTILDGDRISTGTIDANRIRADTILSSSIVVEGQSLGTTVSTANSANNTANSVVAQLNNINSDTVLSISEKSALIIAWTSLYREYETAQSRSVQLFNYGFGDATYSQRIQMENSVITLSSYLSGLSPPWNDMSSDTTTGFNGSTLRYYFDEALLKIRDCNAATNSYTADASSNPAARINAVGNGQHITVAPGVSAGQSYNVASAASSAANAANAVLANINSDAVLDRSEKPFVISQYYQLLAMYQDTHARSANLAIQGSGDVTASQRNTMVTHWVAYIGYLDSLSPYWADVNSDTPNFNGTHLRNLVYNLTQWIKETEYAVNTYVNSWSGDPASRVNNNTTTINGGKLTTGSVTADKILIGSTSGARMTLSNNLLQVFDSGSNLRVRLGVW